MSRHLRRVAQRRLEDGIVGQAEDVSEETSEEETIPASTFLGLQESSDESPESSDVEDSSNLALMLQRARDAEKREAKGQESEEELDELLEKLAATEVASSTSAARDAADEPLAVNMPRLNSALEMRQRFGVQGLQAAEPEGAALPRRRWGGGRRLPGTLLQRRLLFGNYAEEWPRPPSFVSGGIGMERRERTDGRQEFTFKHSDAYEALNEKYKAVLQSHDPNSLALFVGTAGETHAQALLQLAMVCAHTAQPEKAAEFVRRSLAIFEAAQLEAFRPAISQGLARVPYQEEANRPFFNALFRHAQLTHMAGCSGTALEVTKFLLQLDPNMDPTCSWLAIDVYALAARDNQGLAVLTRLYRNPVDILPTTQGASPESPQQVETSNVEVAEAHSDNGIEYQENAPSKLSEQLHNGTAPRSTTNDLLNIAFSASLALWLTDQKADAIRAAVLALSKFPFVLETLLDKMEVHTAGRRSQTSMSVGIRRELGLDAEVGRFFDWPSILEADFFREAMTRWSVPLAQAELSALAPAAAEIHHVPSELGNKISSLFIGRLGSVWKDLVGYQHTDDLLLYAAGRVSYLSQHREPDGIHQVSKEPSIDPWSIEEGTRHMYSNISSGVYRYRAFIPEDFADAFARLPNEMALMNPELLHAGVARAIVRQRRQQIPPNVGDAQLAAMLDFQGLDGLQQGGGVPLDLNRPLAQLLWQSLLPWNTLAR